MRRQGLPAWTLKVPCGSPTYSASGWLDRREDGKVIQNNKGPTQRFCDLPGVEPDLLMVDCIISD